MHTATSCLKGHNNSCKSTEISTNMTAYTLYNKILFRTTRHAADLKQAILLHTWTRSFDKYLPDVDDNLL